MIAGTVFVLYATILADVLPGALGHLLVASFMSLPAGILIARIMVPGTAETDLSEEQESVRYRSTMDAMARGTEDGLKLYLQIIAMLIVTTSLVALANVILAQLPPVCGRAADPGADAGLDVSRRWSGCWACLGRQAGTAGGLMGIKVILNELIAYLRLAAHAARARWIRAAPRSWSMPCAASPILPVSAF